MENATVHNYDNSYVLTDEDSTGETCCKPVMFLLSNIIRKGMTVAVLARVVFRSKRKMDIICDVSIITANYRLPKTYSQICSLVASIPSLQVSFPSFLEAVGYPFDRIGISFFV